MTSIGVHLPIHIMHPDAHVWGGSSRSNLIEPSQPKLYLKEQGL